MGPLCFFVTHYPIVGRLEHQFPRAVHNYHMGFMEHADDDNDGDGDGDDDEAGRAASSSGPQPMDDGPHGTENPKLKAACEARGIELV